MNHADVDSPIVKTLTQTDANQAATNTSNWLTYSAYVNQDVDMELTVNVHPSASKIKNGKMAWVVCARMRIKSKLMTGFVLNVPCILDLMLGETHASASTGLVLIIVVNVVLVRIVSLIPGWYGLMLDGNANALMVISWIIRANVENVHKIQVPMKKAITLTAIKDIITKSLGMPA